MLHLIPWPGVKDMDFFPFQLGLSFGLCCLTESFFIETGNEGSTLKAYLENEVEQPFAKWSTGQDVVVRNILHFYHQL